MNALAIGAFTAAAAVALGAFGAHGLRGIEPARLAWWTTATHYHFIAAFGLMVLGLKERTGVGALSPATALLAGVVFFSGSLYAMTLGAPRWLGAITPLGGLALIAGFVWLGVDALRG